MSRDPHSLLASMFTLLCPSGSIDQVSLPRTRIPGIVPPALAYVGMDSIAFCCLIPCLVPCSTPAGKSDGGKETAARLSVPGYEKRGALKLR